MEQKACSLKCKVLFLHKTIQNAKQVPKAYIDPLVA